MQALAELEYPGKLQRLLLTPEREVLTPPTVSCLILHSHNLLSLAAAPCNMLKPDSLAASPAAVHHLKAGRPVEVSRLDIRDPWLPPPRASCKHGMLMPGQHLGLRRRC